MSICISIGHGKSKGGGYDPGAVSSGLEEFKIAKEIGKYAADYYNRNYAEQCDLINYNADMFLSERYAYANSKNYDFLAEIHLNAGGGTGCEVFRSVTNSRTTAFDISSAISSAFGVKNRGAKTKVTSSGEDYFGIIRETKMEAVLIETLFIDSEADMKLLKTAVGQRKMGETIAAAIAKCRGVGAKATKPPIVAQTDSPGTIYRVQVGAFREKSNAENYVKKLKADGYDAIIVKSS